MFGKKFLSVIALCMALCLTALCASCTFFESYDYVNEAIAKTAGLDAVHISVGNGGSVTVGEKTDTVVSSYDVRINKLLTSAPIFLLETDVTLYGENVPAAVYYEAPYYYVVTENDSVKMESVNAAQNMDVISDWRAMNVPVSEAVLSTAKAADNGNGTKTVSLSPDVNAFYDAYGAWVNEWHEALVSDYVGAYSESGMTITEPKIQITVDTESGYLVSYAISCNVNIASKTTEGEDISVSAALSHITDYHTDTEIEVPEGYTAFELTDGVTLDPYTLTKKAVEGALALNDIDADMHLNVTMQMQGVSMEIPAAIDLRVTGAQTDSPVFDYVETTTAFGESSSLKVYYGNGYFYVDDPVSGQAKYPLTDENEDGFGYASDVRDLLQILSEQVLKGVEVIRNADGTKTVEVSLEETLFIRNYSNLLLEMLMDGQSGLMDISANTITIIVDKDGHLKSYALSFTFNTGEALTYIVDYGIEFKNYGEAVTPEPMDGWQAFPLITDKNREVFDIVNGAIQNTLESDALRVSQYLLNTTTAGGTTTELEQSYVLEAERLTRSYTAYRYELVSNVYGMTFSEDVYYEDGIYYITSDILGGSLKVPAAYAESYNVLNSIGVYLQQMDASFLDSAQTGIDQEGNYWFSFAFGEESFAGAYPSVFNQTSIEGYNVVRKVFQDGSVTVTANSEGELLSYELSYDLQFLLMNMTTGITVDTEAYIIYNFDDSGEPVSVIPPEGYLDFEEYDVNSAL